MGPTLSLRLEFKFTCFVCRAPIIPRPRSELPVDPVEAFTELVAGKKPSVCISCGRDHPFRKGRPAYRRYLQFLAMHVPEEDMAEELRNLA